MDRLEYTIGRYRLLADRQLLDDGVPVRVGRKAIALFQKPEHRLLFLDGIAKAEALAESAPQA